MLAAHRILRGGPRSYDQTILAAGPVAYLPLNETTGTTANDLTGNGHNGTYTGGYTLGQTGIGDGEDAVLLNGTSGYVTIPDSAALDITGNLSLECWINLASIGIFQGLVTKTAGSGTTANPYEFRIESSNRYTLFQANSSGEGFVLSNAGISVSVGNWLYMVATRTSAGVVNLYFNGSGNGSGTINQNPPAASTGDPVLIGTRDDFSYWLHGRIAKVAIYNYILSSAQISAHYAAA